MCPGNGPAVHGSLRCQPRTGRARHGNGGVLPVEIVAHTLRMLGQGVKVAVEVASMACDAGLAQPGQAMIALGGSGSGVDTAVILRPQPTHRLMDTRIDELLANPLAP